MPFARSPARSLARRTSHWTHRQGRTSRRSHRSLACSFVLSHALVRSSSRTLAPIARLLVCSHARSFARSTHEPPPRRGRTIADRTARSLARRSSSRTLAPLARSLVRSHARPLSVCLSVCLCLSVYLSLSVCLSVRPSVCLSVCLSVCRARAAAACLCARAGAGACGLEGVKLTVRDGRLDGVKHLPGVARAAIGMPELAGRERTAPGCTPRCGRAGCPCRLCAI